MNEIFTQTDRLILRKMNENDLDNLRGILQDERVMYAYEGAFSDEEVSEWLSRQLWRYSREGFGLCGVILKENGAFIGQCGLTMQDVPEGRVLEIGYLFRYDCWHKGYATEAALACKKYAFEKLGADRVYSIIRDNNIPSQNVALRAGMERTGEFVKHYRGVDMPHFLYSADNPQRRQ